MEAPEISAHDHRKGAWLLAAALLVLGFLVTKSTLEEAFRKGEFSIDQALGCLFSLFILWRAFRGGPISSKLVKLVAGLFVAIMVLLVAIVALALCLGKPLPIAPNLANTIPVIGNLGVVAYAFWALLFSRRVKSYVARIRLENERRKFGLKTA